MQKLVLLEIESICERREAIEKVQGKFKSKILTEKMEVESKWKERQEERFCLQI